MITATKPNAAHPREGGVWSYVSPSRLNLWLKCSLAFRLRYIDGIRSPTTPALFLGKVVHAALEHVYRHRQLGVTLPQDDVAQHLIESWPKLEAEEGIQFADEAEATALQKKAVDLVTAYLEQLPDDEPKPLAVEATMEATLVDPVTGEDLGIPLLGVMDLTLDTEEGPTLIDFKTSSRSSAPLPITHEIQLSSYAYLFRQLTGQKEASLQIRSLIKTKTPKINIHAYPARTENHFRRLFAVIRAYLDDLDSGRFIYRPGMGCSFCDFRESNCGDWAG